jgi:hypothetical protein
MTRENAGRLNYEAQPLHALLWSSPNAAQITAFKARVFYL